MNKKEDVIAQYSDEELQKEADEIRAIIENQPELQKIEMPEEVHISLMNKIKEYEEENCGMLCLKGIRRHCVSEEKYRIRENVQNGIKKYYDVWRGLRQQLQ